MQNVRSVDFRTFVGVRQQGGAPRMSPEEVEQLLEEVGAIRHGHFELSSGLHSGTYIQCALVFQHPVHSARIAEALAEGFRSAVVQVVVAPAMGGIVLGYELARALEVRSVFVERDSGGRFALRRGFELAPGERVLVAEDVLTTGGSTQETIAVVERAGGKITGVAALLDRSGGRLRFEAPVQALLSRNWEVYAPEACPLCRAGKPLEKPGSRPTRKEEA